MTEQGSGESALIDFAEKRILTERAVSIERAVHRSLNESTGNDYRASKAGL